MMTLVRIAVAAAGAAGLVLASYWALRLGYADSLARKGEAAAVARAVELAPSNASFRAAGIVTRFKTSG